VPFVQGQLTGKPLSVNVTTECAHCGEPIHMEIDNEAQTRVVDTGAAPITFIPDVDFSALPDKCITDAF
jgi:hypothetical protein